MYPTKTLGLAESPYLRASQLDWLCHRSRKTIDYFGDWGQDIHGAGHRSRGQRPSPRDWILRGALALLDIEETLFVVLLQPPLVCWTWVVYKHVHSWVEFYYADVLRSIYENLLNITPKREKTPHISTSNHLMIPD